MSDDTGLSAAGMKGRTKGALRQRHRRTVPVLGLRVAPPAGVSAIHRPIFVHADLRLLQADIGPPQRQKVVRINCVFRANEYLSNHV